MGNRGCFSANLVLPTKGCTEPIQLVMCCRNSGDSQRLRGAQIHKRCSEGQVVRLNLLIQEAACFFRTRAAARFGERSPPFGSSEGASAYPEAPPTSAQGTPRTARRGYFSARIAIECPLTPQQETPTAPPTRSSRTLSGFVFVARAQFCVATA